jgi:DNA invertase Pin-like site-specific DNA recombinase
MRIGYARVSTDDQKLDLQNDALNQARCDRIYNEKESSGKTRPILEQTLEMLRPGDTLVIWKLDRLSRDTLETLKLVKDLAARGVFIHSITDSIDTSTAIGEFACTLFAALAQLERDRLRERTRAGLTAAAARGRKGGRRHKLTPKQVQMARDLLRNPDTMPKDVAAQLGITIATLYRYIPGGRGAVLAEAPPL